MSVLLESDFELVITLATEIHKKKITKIETMAWKYINSLLLNASDDCLLSQKYGLATIYEKIRKTLIRCANFGDLFTQGERDAAFNELIEMIDAIPR